MKRTLKLTLLIIGAVLLTIITVFCWRAFPIVSGYGAKNMCSGIFLSGRSAEDIKANELADFPLSLGSYTVNVLDSSVTGSVLGLAKRTAIYRSGLGATLLNDISKEDFYKQPRPHRILHSSSADSIWFAGNIPGDTIFADIDKKAIEAALDSAFAEPGKEKNRRTRAVVVVYNGRIVAERYATGYNKNTRLPGWSMSKSITNALTGILVKDGKLNVNAPAPIAEWQNDERKKITIKNLMQMSGGLRWEENYNKPSDATNMLYKEKDMGAFAIQIPAEHAPNTVFYYSSGSSNILSHIIRQCIPVEEYVDFPANRLFKKTGMNSAVLEPDAGGTFVGSSYSFATARDWAKFGQLYLNDGIWNGERILPEGWVQFTTTPATTHPEGMYGALWWLNAGAPGNPAKRAYPGVPTDCFWADGYEGQNIWVIPSKKLVIVRLALEHGNLLDCNKFLRDIVRAVK